MAVALTSGLAEVADRYDALLCDVWGVVHDGLRAHEGAAEALSRFRERGPVVLMTNAPRPSAPVVDQLASFGVPREAFDGIVSSGDVVHTHLKAHGPGNVFHLGADRDLSLYDGTALTRVPRYEEADLIVAAGLFDDDTDDLEDYRTDLSQMVRLNKPFVCANPDVIVGRGERTIPCAGALAALYEEEGGVALQFGKPHAPIYEAALALVHERVPEARRILVVGDGLPTDIAGANRQGFDALFVTGGIHDAEVGAPGAPEAEKVAARLGQDGLTATYFAPRMVWA